MSTSWVRACVVGWVGTVALAACSLAGCSSIGTSSIGTSATGASAVGASAVGAGSAAVPSASGGASTAAGSTGAALSGTVTVDAAASLKKSFDTLTARFEKANPGVKVSLSYAGSAVLATQLIGGAPVDVFASADTKNMTKVTAAKLITDKPVEFATNMLQIAVAPGNPRKITGLTDLSAAGLNVDLCAPAQPCGAAAQTALKAAGVQVRPISTEESVTAVLTKVETRNADAGLVYRTDVLGAAGKVTGVDFPEAAEAVNHYPIAVLAAAPNPHAARAFMAFVTGATGRKVLDEAGFGPPAG